ncbi:MAG: hypothetical protein AB4352_10360 [Hormoscilla sp.]
MRRTGGDLRSDRAGESLLIGYCSREVNDMMAVLRDEARKISTLVGKEHAGK